MIYVYLCLKLENFMTFQNFMHAIDCFKLLIDCHLEIAIFFSTEANDNLFSYGLNQLSCVFVHFFKEDWCDNRL